ncbi:energy transducer TonB [Celeribacter marinus]|uniref:energy transducer TonB n=1 Tax=Celeribacter marinus TaxID=1397108 RepID=UPI003F6BDA73
MNTGQYISAAGHFGLIAYALLGGLFLTPEASQPVATQEVALISEAEFAAMTGNSAPEVVQDAPEQAAPQAEIAPQAAPSADAVPQARPQLEPQTPVQDTAPQPPQPLTPQAQVSEQTPPQADPQVSFEDPGAGLPDVPNQEPTPRPVPRIAPEAVTTPEPQPDIADAPTPQVSPDADSAQVVEEDTPEAAPEEATTEIVTEAETPSGMSTSPRPKSRPANLAARAAEARETDRPAPVQQTAPNDAAADAAADAASALIAAAAASDTAQAPTRPVGPPLTGGEREGLRVAVSQCWNVGALSSDAMRTTITVGVSMNQDGTPNSGSLRLIGFSGGSQSAADAAYEVARRAILRCGARGFDLPVEKYDQWRDIEMTFDPEQMRFK